MHINLCTVRAVFVHVFLLTTRLCGRGVHTYISPQPHHVFCDSLAMQCPGTFYRPFFFSLLGNISHYAGHGVSNLTFKLYTNTHLTFGDISFPQRALKGFLLYFLCLLSPRGGLIWKVRGPGTCSFNSPPHTHTHTHLKSEVVHNATVQPFHTHTLISAHTSAHFLLCLPQDILEEESFGIGVEKDNFDWIRGNDWMCDLGIVTETRDKQVDFD